MILAVLESTELAAFRSSSSSAEEEGKESCLDDLHIA